MRLRLFILILANFFLSSKAFLSRNPRAVTTEQLEPDSDDISYENAGFDDDIVIDSQSVHGKFGNSGTKAFLSVLQLEIGIVRAHLPIYNVSFSDKLEQKLKSIEKNLSIVTGVNENELRQNVVVSISLIQNTSIMESLIKHVMRELPKYNLCKNSCNYEMQWMAVLSERINIRFTNLTRSDNVPPFNLNSFHRLANGFIIALMAFPDNECHNCDIIREILYKLTNDVTEQTIPIALNHGNFELLKNDIKSVYAMRQDFDVVLLLASLEYLDGSRHFYSSLQRVKQIALTNNLYKQNSPLLVNTLNDIIDNFPFDCRVMYAGYFEAFDNLNSYLTKCISSYSFDEIFQKKLIKAKDLVQTAARNKELNDVQNNTAVLTKLKIYAVRNFPSFEITINEIVGGHAYGKNHLLSLYKRLGMFNSTTLASGQIPIEYSNTTTVVSTNLTESTAHLVRFENGTVLPINITAIPPSEVNVPDSKNNLTCECVKQQIHDLYIRLTQYIEMELNQKRDRFQNTPKYETLQENNGTRENSTILNPISVKQLENRQKDGSNEFQGQFISADPKIELNNVVVQPTAQQPNHLPLQIEHNNPKLVNPLIRQIYVQVNINEQSGNVPSAKNNVVDYNNDSKRQVRIETKNNKFEKTTENNEMSRKTALNENAKIEASNTFQKLDEHLNNGLLFLVEEQRNKTYNNEEYEQLAHETKNSNATQVFTNVTKHEEPPSEERSFNINSLVESAASKVRVASRKRISKQKKPKHSSSNKTHRKVTKKNGKTSVKSKNVNLDSVNKKRRPLFGNQSRLEKLKNEIKNATLKEVSKVELKNGEHRPINNINDILKPIGKNNKSNVLSSTVSTNDEGSGLKGNSNASIDVVQPNGANNNGILNRNIVKDNENNDQLNVNSGDALLSVQNDLKEKQANSKFPNNDDKVRIGEGARPFGNISIGKGVSIEETGLSQNDAPNGIETENSDGGLMKTNNAKGDAIVPLTPMTKAEDSSLASDTVTKSEGAADSLNNVHVADSDASVNTSDRSGINEAASLKNTGRSDNANFGSDGASIEKDDNKNLNLNNSAANVNENAGNGNDSLAVNNSYGNGDADSFGTDNADQLKEKNSGNEATDFNNADGTNDNGTGSFDGNSTPQKDNGVGLFHNIDGNDTANVNGKIDNGEESVIGIISDASGDAKNNNSKSEGSNISEAGLGGENGSDNANFDTEKADEGQMKLGNESGSGGISLDSDSSSGGDKGAGSDGAANASFESVSNDGVDSSGALKANKGDGTAEFNDKNDGGNGVSKVEEGGDGANLNLVTGGDAYDGIDGFGSLSLNNGSDNANLNLNSSAVASNNEISGGDSAVFNELNNDTSVNQNVGSDKAALNNGGENGDSGVFNGSSDKGNRAIFANDESGNGNSGSGNGIRNLSFNLINNKDNSANDSDSNSGLTGQGSASLPSDISSTGGLLENNGFGIIEKTIGNGTSTLTENSGNGEINLVN